MTPTEFFSELSTCNLCKERNLVRRLSRGRDVPVPAEGNFTARIAFIGRNPGATEARTLTPFCGAAGDKLNEALITAGIRRGLCYITNVCKCFTPSGVSPSITCRDRCTGRWLKRELEQLTELKLVVTLGNEALQFLEPEGTVSQLHGTSFNMSVGDSRTTVFVMFHPAACLYDPRIKQRFFADAAELGKVVKELEL